MIDDRSKEELITEADLMAKGFLKPGQVHTYNLTPAGKNVVASILGRLNLEEQYLITAFFIELADERREH